MNEIGDPWKCLGFSLRKQGAERPKHLLRSEENQILHDLGIRNSRKSTFSEGRRTETTSLLPIVVHKEIQQEDRGKWPIYGKQALHAPNLLLVPPHDIPLKDGAFPSAEPRGSQARRLTRGILVSCAL